MNNINDTVGVIKYRKRNIFNAIDVLVMPPKWAWKGIKLNNEWQEAYYFNGRINY